jgi:hypothetical protein
VFIMTTIQTQRPTLIYVACFYPDLTAFAFLLLSRHSQQDSRSNQRGKKHCRKPSMVAPHPRVFCGLLPSNQLRDALT